MRVVLVGTPRDRARLRARLDAAMDVVGEFATLAAAREAGLDFEAILMPPDRPPPLDDSGDERDETIQEPLTAREIQVLELLAEGLSNKAVAARLGISDQTVKFHVASLSGKLGAVNRTDAVRRAVRRGLISL
jgi:NarL family two-component system response regulator YdfI